MLKITATFELSNGREGDITAYLSEGDRPTVRILREAMKIKLIQQLRNEGVFAEITKLEIVKTEGAK